MAIHLCLVKKSMKRKISNTTNYNSTEVAIFLQISQFKCMIYQNRTEIFCSLPVFGVVLTRTSYRGERARLKFSAW